MEDATTTHTLDAADLGPAALRDREWLLTNGTGAYAMGTALGANTRRYHGLLVAAARPPVGRVLALNQVFDQLVLTDADGEEHRVELGSGLFRDDHGQLVHAPQGHQTLTAFARGLTVQWTYTSDGVTVTRELLLHHREPAATLRYRIAGLKKRAGSAALYVAPMLTLRDFHGLTLSHEDATPFAVKPSGGGRRVTVSRHDTAVTLASEDGTFTEAPDWWRGVVYPRDTHRGQGDTEDHFVPGRFVLPLTTTTKTAEATLTVTLGKSPAEPRKKSKRIASIRKAVGVLTDAGLDEEEATPWAIAADDFVVRREVDGKPLTTIMAGYPWFADWGRDTFIALPGLLLSTGRHNEARDVLRAFAGSVRGGLVPNRFDDYTNQPHYNTVDASLWYLHAALGYAAATGKLPGWLKQAATAIVEAYATGTEAQGHDGRALPIGVGEDGLVAAGDATSQLTWMDAACGGVVFTPRPGRCVEINALWHHGLVGLAAALDEHGSTKADRAMSERCNTLGAAAKRAFVKTFWSDELGRLIDHVTPEGERDLSLRPNMILACSLEHSPLALPKRKAVIAEVREKLLTPVGLRTLPDDDPAYHPGYGGPQFDRDRAYHQGTVWPWLLGPYAEAVLRAGKFGCKAKAEAAAAIRPLLDRLTGEGLGQLAEIHDAASPHDPRGCPAQAWSVAEALRVRVLLASRA